MSRIEICHEILQNTETLSLQRADVWCPQCKRKLDIPLDYKDDEIEIAGTHVCIHCRTIWVIKVWG